ncbi:MAG: hypothetical protein PHO80_01220 [Candidatus Gracilibacteria bacterium]|nr:hypothetical protein [Candidatus Gracilibacteria bacterium]MDD4530155.1 hypothetical protein [Candidatus Gracilibacteria bacterium]
MNEQNINSQNEQKPAKKIALIESDKKWSRLLPEMLQKKLEILIEDGKVELIVTETQEEVEDILNKGDLAILVIDENQSETILEQIKSGNYEKPEYILETCTTENGKQINDDNTTETKGLFRCLKINAGKTTNAIFNENLKIEKTTNE